MRKLRPSVLATITIVVMVGLSFLPTQGNRTLHTAHANHQSYQLQLTEQHGTWMLNRYATTDLTVVVPPHTRLQLASDASRPVEAVRVSPFHQQVGKRPVVFSSTSARAGVQIDGQALGIGKYQCQINVHGATAPITFELAVTPAVSQPEIKRS